jgi:hypothetical protein
VATNRGSVNTIWPEYCLRRGGPLSELFGPRPERSKFPVATKVRKLITEVLSPPISDAGLKLSRNVDQRFLGQIILRLLTRSPLSPLLESRRSRRGPINIALLSLQGGWVAVKGGGCGGARETCWSCREPKIQYMKSTRHVEAWRSFVHIAIVVHPRVCCCGRKPVTSYMLDRQPGRRSGRPDHLFLVALWLQRSTWKD